MMKTGVQVESGPVTTTRLYYLSKLEVNPGMKKVLLLMAILLGGVITGVVAGLLMPAKQREKLSRSLATPIEHCLGRMPDG